MSKVSFNDDLSLEIPYGFGTSSVYEDGEKSLRIAGPDASSYLSSSKGYDCDFRLSVSQKDPKPASEIDITAKLREVSEKIGEIKISVSVNGGQMSDVGGSGFRREYRVITDEDHLKAGYFTMGIIGKTAYIGAVFTDQAVYTIMSLDSESYESAGRYLPRILENISLLHEPLSPEEREAQRLAREKADRERREREAEERRKREKAEQERKKKEAEKKAAFDMAVAEWKKKADQVVEKREKERKASLSRFEQAKRKAIEKTAAEAKNAAEKKLARAGRDGEEAKEKLKSLGFFAFSEKKEQKRRIAEAEGKAAEAKAELETAEKDREAALDALPARTEEKEAALLTELEKKYPLPTPPAGYTPPAKYTAKTAPAPAKAAELPAKSEPPKAAEEKPVPKKQNKHAVARGIGWFLVVAGAPTLLISVINGCQGGKDTSGWFPFIIGSFFAIWIGIRLLNDYPRDT